MTSIPALKAFLRRHSFDAKKSLGQHWLCSASIADEIVAACLPASGVLEIGPGPGVLTQRLAKQAKVAALDLDKRAADALAESAPEARVLIGDVLKQDLREVLESLPVPRAVVSNLPYYITAAVITRLSEVSDAFARAVLMMQSEVADKLLAKPGDSRRGSLSVYVQMRFELETICRVPGASFFPAPKVESKVLRFTPRPGEWDSRLGRLIQEGFKQPRKTLANNLIAAGYDRLAAEAALRESDLSSLVRPHSLSEEDWRRLASRIHSLSS